MNLLTTLEQTKCDLILLFGKLRRLCITRFAGGQSRKSTGRRQGSCRQCAACCKFIFRCPLLDENNLCKIYHSRLRPEVCRRFPIDKRDTDDVMLSSGRQCGYRFAESPPTRRYLQ